MLVLDVQEPVAFVFENTRVFSSSHNFISEISSFKTSLFIYGLRTFIYILEHNSFDSEPHFRVGFNDFSNWMIHRSWSEMMVRRSLFRLGLGSVNHLIQIRTSEWFHESYSDWDFGAGSCIIWVRSEPQIPDCIFFQILFLLSFKSFLGGFVVRDVLPGLKDKHIYTSRGHMGWIGIPP